MAETILNIVIDAVLSKALSLASEDIISIWGVHEDVQNVVEKLEMIQALLSDAERRDPSSGAVQLWLKKLRAVATDADNLLDQMAYEGLRNKIEKENLDKVSNFFSISNPLVFRFQMAKKIKRINLALNEVYQESNLIGLRPVDIVHTSLDIRKAPITHPFLDDSKIVGRGNDMEKIMRELTCSEEEKDLPVIGIVGMAGQGKTTLAQLIYKNEKISSYFEKRIWVCVSEDFKVGNILNDMVQSLTGEKSELTIREAMVRKLKAELSNKRFLLVLDDVWNEEEDLWECMRECLQGMCGSKGSRIILTTRSQRVATTMQAYYTHHLGVLSGEDSWTLFEKIAFANGGAVKTPELVEIGKRIVERCGGVPLAIKTLGGLMYSRRDEHEWFEIQENESWSCSNVVDRVQSAIKLSYDHLPSLSIKQCFAFCSIYEKDTVLVRETLVQLWMAQGLLNPSRGDPLEKEKIGNKYFDILLQRSFFQDAEINECGSIVSCKMHDLVHDFAMRVSEGYCLILKDGHVKDDNKAAHLKAMGFSEKKMLNMSRGSLERLQSLILYRGSFKSIKLIDCRYIRVLVVDDHTVDVLPSSVAQLKHLRYLDISRTCIRALSNTITKMYHLQTLRVPFLFELPTEIRNLVNLRHLYIVEHCRLPQGIGNLSSLHTLPYFKIDPVRNCQIEELGTLQHLAGKLKIDGLENVCNHDEAMKAKLSDKPNLEVLELMWEISRTREQCKDESILEGLRPHSNLKVLRISGFAGAKLPSWMINQSQPLPLRNLVKIELGGFCNCKQIPTLGHLPYLKVLEINYMDSLKCLGSEFYGWTFIKSQTSYSQSSSIVAFPSLKRLRFYSMSDWEEWSSALQPSYFSTTLFPHLEQLEISYCPKLTCIPEEVLKDLSSLQSLRIANCHSLSHLPHGLSGLISLVKLEIEYCDNLVFVPDIRCLRSLQRLNILKCKKLTALPSGLEQCTSIQMLTLYLVDASGIDGLRYLTSLRTLRLYLSENVDTDYFPWPICTYSSDQTEDSIRQECPFGSLKLLYLKGTRKIKSLPEQIQHLPALNELQLDWFDGLETLPEWIGNISTLRNLEVQWFERLACLPSAETLQCLTSLIIRQCPIMAKRCERDGPEWHKIAQIPKLEISREDLRRYLEMKSLYSKDYE